MVRCFCSDSFAKKFLVEGVATERIFFHVHSTFYFSLRIDPANICVVRLFSRESFPIRSLEIFDPNLNCCVPTAHDPKLRPRRPQLLRPSHRTNQSETSTLNGKLIPCRSISFNSRAFSWPFSQITMLHDETLRSITSMSSRTSPIRLCRLLFT